MKVVEAGYEILTPISKGALDELKHIEQIARVCYKSEGNITEDGESAKRLIRQLIKNHHEAMLEHSTLAVKFICDRGVSHELVRHRVASYAQESTRYCNYSGEKFNKNISVIGIINGINLQIGDNTDDKTGILSAEWIDAMQDAERHYMRMIELGASPQIARSVLPTSTKTEIVITANYREWRTILKLRTAKAAHPQMREVMIPLLKELQIKIPIIFEDIEDNA